MARCSNLCFLALITILFLGNPENTEAGKTLKTEVYLSPKFELEPGSVINTIFPKVSFPKGHIAIKYFNAEVVDSSGKSVPLHETYLHHWLLLKVHRPKNSPENFTISPNSGLCGLHLPQYYGLGSETRKTNTSVPDPYGIEIGNPVGIPAGYEEGWAINVHAIDTRGAKDKRGCTECWCNLYNVTKDEDGNPLDKDYLGGLKCCLNGLKCGAVRKGYQGAKRTLYLRYTVKYVDWDSSIVPVKIYILDVTETNNNGSSCQTEYQVAPCSGPISKRNCIDVKKTTVTLPTSGDLIYGVAHQHAGGLGSTLYGQDGRVLCSSIPVYGTGTEAGNEKGYVVGMSTCFPKQGSVKIAKGEPITLVSRYGNNPGHAGVMGLFYLLVAESKKV